MRLIDTHAHLNFNDFKTDRDKVIKRTLLNRIWIINVGTNFLTSKKAVEISLQYPEGVFASVGLHPINLDTGLIKMKKDRGEGRGCETFFDYEKYKRLAKQSKVVAIGEIGLDYYWRPKTTKKKELFKQKQKELLAQELKLAKELGLPVIFHCRMANQDLIEFLVARKDIRPKKAVAHSFVGSLEELQTYLGFGFYIGFNGIIFKSIKGIDFERNIKNTPLKQILLETDCPYLAPPSKEGQRNEPIYLEYIAEKIAQIKSSSYAEITKQATLNARALFKI